MTPVLTPLEAEVFEIGVFDGAAIFVGDGEGVELFPDPGMLGLLPKVNTYSNRERLGDTKDNNNKRPSLTCSMAVEHALWPSRPLIGVRQIALFPALGWRAKDVCPFLNGNN